MSNQVRMILIIGGAALFIYMIISQQDKERESEVLAALRNYLPGMEDHPPGVAGAASTFDECIRQKQILQRGLDGTKWIMFRTRANLKRKIRELPC